MWKTYSGHDHRNQSFFQFVCIYIYIYVYMPDETSNEWCLFSMLAFFPCVWFFGVTGSRLGNVKCPWTASYIGGCCCLRSFLTHNHLRWSCNSAHTHSRWLPRFEGSQQHQRETRWLSSQEWMSINVLCTIAHSIPEILYYWISFLHIII